MDPRPLCTQSSATPVPGNHQPPQTTPATSHSSPHSHQTPRLVPSYFHIDQRVLPGSSWTRLHHDNMPAQSSHAAFTTQASNIPARISQSGVSMPHHSGISTPHHSCVSASHHQAQTTIPNTTSTLIDEPALKPPYIGDTTDSRIGQSNLPPLAYHKSPPFSPAAASHGPDRTHSYQPPAYRYRPYSLRERGAADKGKGRAVEKRYGVHSDEDERKSEEEDGPRYNYGYGGASQGRAVSPTEVSALIASAALSHMPIHDRAHRPAHSPSAETPTLPPINTLHHNSIPRCSDLHRPQDALSHGWHHNSSRDEPYGSHGPHQSYGDVYSQSFYGNSYPYQTATASKTSSESYQAASRPYHDTQNQYDSRPTATNSLHFKTIQAYQTVFSALVQECHYTVQTLHYTPFQAYMARAWDQYEARGREDTGLLVDQFEKAVRGEAAERAKHQLQPAGMGYEGDPWCRGYPVRADISGRETAYGPSYTDYQRSSTTSSRDDPITLLRQTYRPNLNRSQTLDDNPTPRRKSPTPPRSRYSNLGPHPLEAEEDEQEQTGSKDTATNRRLKSLGRSKGRTASLGLMSTSLAPAPLPLITAPKRRRASLPHPSTSARYPIKLLASQYPFRDRFNLALKKLYADGDSTPVYLGGVRVKTLEDALGRGRGAVGRWRVGEVERIARMAGTMLLDEDRAKDAEADDTFKTADDQLESKNAREKRKNAFRWFRKSLISVYVANGGKEAFDRWDRQVQGVTGREKAVGEKWEAFTAEVEEIWGRVTRELAQRKRD
ncbi:hypothetical protein L202_03196 [Cryptococcus amylolentus CBS 6039]|uniref:Uncharacterized protein n=2 Tax=Cryptococcus amylolentus TaxID=104669 RepID=A0A1E3HZW8_9TREE|nr:hypothetical protein L202_03196 [Cryptococcus amylolentus CBS 6039]ODN81101.1 hypothetical protein L202_03196 [Cryptococcus amylolentus CBS 6039]ODO09561.1 hypothetical protein I350_03164 [Cryptococcus amylolentus CBS 6273]